MKTKIFILLIICLPIFVWGQKDETHRFNLPGVEVTPPEFTGIENVNQIDDDDKTEDLKVFLNANFEYPEEVIRCYEEGTAILQFIVTVEGELTDFNMLNSFCPLIDNELIRVLKTTDGMWKPGFNNKKPVEMEKEVSIMFAVDRENQQITIPIAICIHPQIRQPADSN